MISQRFALIVCLAAHNCWVRLNLSGRFNDNQDMTLLVVAVCAVSTSAVLVRWADASPIALAFWRTAGGAVFLAVIAGTKSVGRQSIGQQAIDRLSKDIQVGDRQAMDHQWFVVGVAGIALAAHFMGWLSSLEQTTVAASVTLVTTTPLFIAAALRAFPALRCRRRCRVDCVERQRIGPSPSTVGRCARPVWSYDHGNLFVVRSEVANDAVNR